MSPDLHSALTGLNHDRAARLSPAWILWPPLLGSLMNTEQATWLAQRMAIWRLRRWEVLVHQGKPDRAFHIVCTGCMPAVRQGRQGRPPLPDVPGPGGHVGACGLSDESPRETPVRCALATGLLTVHRADLRQCLAESDARRHAPLRTLKVLAHAVRQPLHNAGGAAQAEGPAGQRQAPAGTCRRPVSPGRAGTGQGFR